MTGHTPWKYIPHKNDRFYTRWYRKIALRAHRWRHRKVLRNQERAMRGETTSGYLSPGDRRLFFSQRKRLRNRPRRR